MSSNKPQLGIVGGGPMGRSIARLLSTGEVDIRLFVRREEQRRQLALILPRVTMCESIKEATEGMETVFFAVPASDLSPVANAYGDHATADQIVFCATRGVGPGFALAHEMIRAQTCVRKIGILGGPLHMSELQAGRQLNMVSASRFSEVQKALFRLTKNSPISVHPTKDVVGVAICGAIANVASIAAGMAEALDLGDTARGVLLTHGLAEARRLGLAQGANPLTFAGMAGVGELIPRQVTSMDRHLQLGRLLAADRNLSEAMEELNGHVEGVQTAEEARQRAQQLGIHLPLTEAICKVIEGKQAAREAMESILKLSITLQDNIRVGHR